MICDDTSLRLALAGPFIVGLLLGLASSEISRLIRRQVVHHVSEANTRLDPVSERLPVHVRDESIGDYAEYAADAVQAILAPVTVLVGAIFALINGLSSLATAILLVLGFILIIVLIIRMLDADPSEYVATRWLWRYTPIAAIGILLNAAGVGAIWIFAQCE
jgi:hypothetical protein